MGVLSRISKINPWHFLWIATVLSEVFTLISTAVLSLVWWGAVSRDLLIIGSIDALVVSLPVAGIVIYFLNKTYRLAAEVQAHKAVATSLKSRGAYFQTILNVFPDPLMVINADYTIDFTNAAAQNFAGRDSIVGSLTCYEASHQASAPCDGASHPCPMEMVRTRKEMVHVQHEHFDGQGRRRWVDIHAAPLFDMNGEVHQIIEYSRDVTAQKNAEVRLQENEKRYRHILAVAPDVITITRLEDGRYLEVNDYFCNLTGYTREEALGRTPFDLNLFVRPEDRDRLVAALQQNGEVQDMDLQYRQKNGNVIDTLLSARRLCLGGEDCLVAVTRDITERRRKSPWRRVERFSMPSCSTCLPWRS